MVQHITTWFTKVDEVKLSDTALTCKDLEDLSNDMQKLAQASFDSEHYLHNGQKTMPLLKMGITTKNPLPNRSMMPLATTTCTFPQVP